MFSWNYLIGGLAYIIIGIVMSNVTANYLQELTDKVMDVYHDERYARMLWFSVPVENKKINMVIVSIVFTVFWPVICIASIMKAEWNYDKIMRRNAFRKNAQ